MFYRSSDHFPGCHARFFGPVCRSKYPVVGIWLFSIRDAVLVGVPPARTGTKMRTFCPSLSRHQKPRFCDRILCSSVGQCVFPCVSLVIWRPEELKLQITILCSNLGRVRQSVCREFRVSWYFLVCQSTDRRRALSSSVHIFLLGSRLHGFGRIDPSFMEHRASGIRADLRCVFLIFHRV